MSLVVIGEVKRVEFHGQEIQAAFCSDGRLWVVLKRICENLGIDRASQAKKIQDNPAYAGRWRAIPLPSNGGMQDAFCIDLDALVLWLGSISASRVKRSVREMLIFYQRECMDVLRKHFFGASNQWEDNWYSLPTILETEETEAIQQLKGVWFQRWESERREEEKRLRAGQDSATEGGESTATLEAVVGPIFGAIQSLEGKIDQQQEILTGGYTLLDAQGISPARLQRLRSMVQRITSLNDGQLACLDDCISSLEKGMYLQISPPSR